MIIDLVKMQQLQQIKEFASKVIEIADETPTVKSFKIELPDSSLSFYPGQFFMVSFQDDAEIKTARAYSIASSPMEKKYLEIALNKVGPFTTKMFQLKPGDLLKFKGPYGKFYFSEDIKNNLVLIAGGTGITPLIGIIRYCTDKCLSNKIRFIYSVRTPDEIIYKSELEKLKKINENFDYVVTITRAEDSHNWNSKKGRINLELLKESINDIENSLYFLCGPKEFVDSVISMLQSLGAKREQIKTDVWG